MGKRGLFWGMLLCVWIIGNMALASTEHTYMNGKLLKIDKETILIGEETLRLTPGIKVLRHWKRGNSIYEEPAKISDLKPGQWVSVKVLGGFVKEIIIEEYKK